MESLIANIVGILLPTTCTINHVNMQPNYAEMRLTYVDMQHKLHINIIRLHVDIHVIYHACRRQKYVTILQAIFFAVVEKTVLYIK